MSKKYRPTKVVTGVVRLLNAHIWEPTDIPGYDDFYSATILIPKEDVKTILGINTAIDSAIAVGMTTHGGTRGRKPYVKLPLHDGDIDCLASGFQGYYYINAASLTAPQVFDHQLFLVTDSTTVGSGSWVRVSLSFFFIYEKGRSYIGCELGNIQKARISDSYEPLEDAGFESFLDEYFRIFEKPGQRMA